MGGSDQWGNIINGIDLHRRVSDENSKETLFGLTSPLITTASGTKMGKTANGAIWLNSNLCSSWDYWQFWRNTEDKDVIRFLKLFTEINLNEIKKLEKLEGAEINDAKIILANAATTLLHGKEETEKALSTAKNIFENKDGDANLPIIVYNNTELTEGISILECLTDNSYLAASKGEARRLIRGAGVKLSNVIVSDENLIINNTFFSEKKRIKLSVGKKKHILLEKR
jgi:tyrosyl-tRNA synthetase